MGEIAAYVHLIQSSNESNEFFSSLSARLIGIGVKTKQENLGDKLLKFLMNSFEKYYKTTIDSPPFSIPSRIANGLAPGAATARNHQRQFKFTGQLVKFL